MVTFFLDIFSQNEYCSNPQAYVLVIYIEECTHIIIFFKHAKLITHWSLVFLILIKFIDHYPSSFNTNKMEPSVTLRRKILL